MATPKVQATLTAAWADVIGAAASIAGVTWQNVSQNTIQIAFTTSAPAAGATDAFHSLAPGAAYYDKNGSAHCWARGLNAGQICATAD